MTEEVAEAPAVEAVAPVVETPPPVETQQEPIPERAPDKKPIPTHVPRQVVEQVRERARTAEARAQEAERKLAAAEAMIQKQATPDAPIKPAVPLPPDDVERRAQELIINRDIGRVNDAGVREYGRDWQELVNVLTDFDLNNPQFLTSVMDVDPSKAHEILYQITRDGDQLSNLARMSPARRIAEITRMTMTPERGVDGKFVATKEVEAPPPVKEAPKQVSKAPPPAPPVNETAKTTVDWRMAESEEDFQKGWEEMMEKRTKSGRKYGR